MSDTNNIIPHQAIINLRGEVMVRLPDGKASGRPLHLSSHLFTLKGDSLEDCRARFNAFVEAINRIQPGQVEEIMKEQYEQKCTEKSR